MNVEERFEKAQVELNQLLEEEGKKPKLQRIPIARIHKDPVLQVREGLKTERVLEYAQVVKHNPEDIPPIRAFQEGEWYWVPDGYHRLAAHEAQNPPLTFIRALVSQGTKADAILEAVSANARHGEPRTNTDNRRAIKTLLVELPEWQKNSDRQIAKACLLTDHHLVGIVAGELEEQGLIEKRGKREGADGRTIDPKNIGKSTKESTGGIPQSKSQQTSLRIDSATTRNTNALSVFDQAAKRLEAPSEPPSLEETVNGHFQELEAEGIDPLNEQQVEARRRPSPKENREEWQQKQAASRSAKHASIAEECKAAQKEGQLGPFSVLYIDPPWQYDARISEAKAIEAKYPTLSLEELCKLNVPAITHKQAVLYLWVTAPMALAAAQLLEAWGFSYKTQYVWCKFGGSGLGHWLRGDHELLYVATKGNFPTPAPEDRDSSVIQSPRTKHSEKPRWFRQHLEALYPNHPRVELFARETSPGWVSLGNEIDGKDIRDVLSQDHRQTSLPLDTPLREASLTEEEKASLARFEERKTTCHTLYDAISQTAIEPVWRQYSDEDLARLLDTTESHIKGVRGSPAMLVAHYQEHPEVTGEWRCAYCKDATFPTNHVLAQHYQEHFNQKEYGKLSSGEPNPWLARQQTELEKTVYCEDFDTLYQSLVEKASEEEKKALEEIAPAIRAKKPHRGNVPPAQVLAARKPILCLHCGERPQLWSEFLAHYRTMHKFESRGLQTEFEYDGKTFQTFDGTYPLAKVKKALGIAETETLLENGEVAELSVWVKLNTTTRISLAPKAETTEDNEPTENPLQKTAAKVSPKKAAPKPKRVKGKNEEPPKKKTTKKASTKKKGRR